jgi:DNA-binding CsgD family transcriptional regulator/PAS domain-containing protein
MLARADLQQIESIRAELRTIRIGEPSAVETVLEEVRELLGTDVVSFYTVGERGDGYELTRWHQNGGDLACGPLLSTAIRRTPRSPMFYYDAFRTPADQRNRPIEATAWIDRHVPGTWAQSRMCREVLAPIGLHRHKQLRVLVCEGPSLLGWFGALQPRKVTRRQVLLMRALVAPMQQRLAIERHLGEAPRSSNALQRALDHVGVAAFVIGARGRIHEANVAGRALLEHQRADVVQALTEAAAGRPNKLGIEAVPLADRGVPGYSLALVRHDDVETRVTTCVRTCVEYWGLTPRQAEVLALATRGLANATIAAMLHVGERSIELHMTAIFDRAGVDSRAALVSRVLLSG